MEGGSVSYLVRILSINHSDFSLKTEDSAGMIPRAVETVFRVAQVMESKGWEYKIEGQFLEIVSLV